MNWKVPGWAAAAGAVVSLAAGLAGGNGFGTVLLRALVSALIAGALGFGAQYLLHRFLPGAGPAEAPPAVDILIDEELPLAVESGGEAAAGSLEEEMGLEPAEAEAVPGFEPAEELGLGEAEPAEAEPAEAEPFSGPPVEALEEAVESLEPLEGEMELPSGETLEALSAGEAGQSAAGGSGAAPRRAPKAEELEAQLDSVTKGQDPATLAKAVRSFLRKDQEG